MKQFNGWYGCPKCKIRGERIENVQVYPFEENLNLRTSEETVQYGNEALLLKKDIFGIKGPSILSEITHNFIVATTIDIMHCIYINDTKKLMSLWFDVESQNLAFSLRPFLPEINKILSQIRPINSVEKKPRSLDEYAYWKASELKYFLLVYSLPILKRYMLDVYFHHHILLIYGISILNSTSISEDNLIDVEKILKEYVKRFEILYGKRHMTCNIHSILHLVEVVRHFGPLFVTSCSPFENLNGILKGFVHGSKNPELQIHSSVSMLLNLKKLKDTVLKKNSNVALFCKSMEERSNTRKKLNEISDKTFIIGKC